MITREMIMQAIEELKEYGISEPTAYEIRDMVKNLYPVDVDTHDIILVMPDGSLPWSLQEWCDADKKGGVYGE